MTYLCPSESDFDIGTV